mmetsp:Transcript_10885/g.20815  ORF Transcript_10885/g.20815 Transcript_10885/m.20815 type:complete len:109 (+) Transcript_10885:167-493(+)
MCLVCSIVSIQELSISFRSFFVFSATINQLIVIGEFTAAATGKILPEKRRLLALNPFTCGFFSVGRLAVEDVRAFLLRRPWHALHEALDFPELDARDGLQIDETMILH